jgi:hypothetical protein
MYLVYLGFEQHEGLTMIHHNYPWFRAARSIGLGRDDTLGFGVNHWVGTRELAGVLVSKLDFESENFNLRLTRGECEIE